MSRKSKSSQNDHKQNRTTYQIWIRRGNRSVWFYRDITGTMTPKIRVWAAPTGQFFTGPAGCNCASSVLGRHSVQFQQNKWGPFPSIVVWGMFKTFWRIMNGKIWAGRCGDNRRHSRKRSIVLWFSFRLFVRHISSQTPCDDTKLSLRTSSFETLFISVWRPEHVSTIFNPSAWNSYEKKPSEKITTDLIQNKKIRIKQMFKTC